MNNIIEKIRENSQTLSNFMGLIQNGIVGEGILCNGVIEVAAFHREPDEQREEYSGNKDIWVVICYQGRYYQIKGISDSWGRSEWNYFDWKPVTLKEKVITY